MSVVSDNLENFRDYFPSAGGVNGEYQPTDNAGKILGSDCTSSFWTVMIWLAYELTGEEKFKETGLHHSESFRERYEKNDILDHHDIGFLYSLSCVAAYKLTGDEFSKSESSNALLKAGVYAFKSNLCVNEPTIWGDYFYMEALMRLTHVHRIFW